MILRDFDELIEEELLDPEFASGYLQDALEEGGIPLFLLALRHFIKVKKGFSQVEKEIGLETETLDKICSENNDYSLNTIEKILRALGLKFSIVTIEN